MAKPTTSGFTISGLLDRSASIRNDYPVERIPIEEIADHPANAAYSMDEAGIAQLAKSIEEEGLTDLPLVRKLDDGGWQMVSGHRRKAAYALLAKEDEKYAQIPCRVIRGITDEQSVMLLHAANYFVRSLTVTERAAASRALGVEVERMRAENPELSGVRTEDIKAAIISEQTGRKVSGKTIQRQESLARKIEERLTPQWREAALADALSADAVGILADLDSDAQDRLHATWRAQPLGKKETTEFLKKSTAEPAAEEDAKGPAPKPAAALASALRALRRYESKAEENPPSELDRQALGEIADEEGLTRSEYLRYVARMVADDAENAKRGGVLLDGLSMRRLSRELVRWGHHYNQGVHALNSIKFALDHGRGDLEWVSGKLDECALLLAQVDEGRCKMAGELASLEGRAIVGGD